MVWLAALLLFQVRALDMPSTDKNPYSNSADIEQGKKLYGGRCAGCHGPAGDGGKGTNLAAPMLPRAQTDLALYRVMRYGIPETEMPGHNMTEREIWQMAAYVRTLGRIKSEKVTGDARRGEALVRGSGGCLQCHVLNGDGGLMGPPLTGIGLRRSPSYLRRKLLDPAADISDFSLVELSTRSGLKLSGVRMNEDTYSIQVRDMNHGLHSFWKHDLTTLKVERRTLMPSYIGRFAERELHDVLAFLVGLRGAK